MKNEPFVCIERRTDVFARTADGRVMFTTTDGTRTSRRVALRGSSSSLIITIR